MGTASGFAERVAALHRALTHELSRLADAVPGVAVGDVATAQVLGTWAFDVVDALHHYLRALEAWVRPVVAAQEGDDEFAAEVLRAAERDHAAVESQVRRALAAALRWQDGAAAADRDALAVHLGRLRSGTTVAFPRIEGDLAPLADRLVAGDQLAAVTQHPVTALGGRRGRAVSGAVLVVGGAAATAPTGRFIRLLARIRDAAARREYRRRTAVLAGRLP